MVLPAVAEFDPALGLEVHVELGTRTKMFDAAPTEFGADRVLDAVDRSFGW